MLKLFLKKLMRRAVYCLLILMLLVSCQTKANLSSGVINRCADGSVNSGTCYTSAAEIIRNSEGLTALLRTSGSSVVGAMANTQDVTPALFDNVISNNGGSVIGTSSQGYTEAMAGAMMKIIQNYNSSISMPTFSGNNIIMTEGFKSAAAGFGGTASTIFGQKNATQIAPYLAYKPKIGLIGHAVKTPFANGIDYSPLEIGININMLVCAGGAACTAKGNTSVNNDVNTDFFYNYKVGTSAPLADGSTSYYAFGAYSSPYAALISGSLYLPSVTPSTLNYTSGFAPFSMLYSYDVDEVFLNKNIFNNKTMTAADKSNARANIQNAFQGLKSQGVNTTMYALSIYPGSFVVSGSGDQFNNLYYSDFNDLAETYDGVYNYISDYLDNSTATNLASQGSKNLLVVPNGRYFYGQANPYKNNTTNDQTTLSNISGANDIFTPANYVLQMATNSKTNALNRLLLVTAADWDKVNSIYKLNSDSRALGTLAQYGIAAPTNPNQNIYVFRDISENSMNTSAPEAFTDAYSYDMSMIASSFVTSMISNYRVLYPALNAEAVVFLVKATANKVYGQNMQWANVKTDTSLTSVTNTQRREGILFVVKSSDEASFYQAMGVSEGQLYDSDVLVVDDNDPNKYLSFNGKNATNGGSILYSQGQGYYDSGCNSQTSLCSFTSNIFGNGVINMSSMFLATSPSAVSSSLSVNSQTFSYVNTNLISSPIVSAVFQSSAFEAGISNINYNFSFQKYRLQTTTSLSDKVYDFTSGDFLFNTAVQGVGANPNAVRIGNFNLSSGFQNQFNRKNFLDQNGMIIDPSANNLVGINNFTVADSFGKVSFALNYIGNRFAGLDALGLSNSNDQNISPLLGYYNYQTSLAPHLAILGRGVTGGAFGYNSGGLTYIFSAYKSGLNNSLSGSSSSSGTSLGISYKSNKTNYTFSTSLINESNGFLGTYTAGAFAASGSTIANSVNISSEIAGVDVSGFGSVGITRVSRQNNSLIGASDIMTSAYGFSLQKKNLGLKNSSLSFNFTVPLHVSNNANLNIYNNNNLTSVNLRSAVERDMELSYSLENPVKINNIEDYRMSFGLLNIQNQYNNAQSGNRNYFLFNVSTSF